MLPASSLATLGGACSSDKVSEPVAEIQLHADNDPTPTNQCDLPGQTPPAVYCQDFCANSLSGNCRGACVTDPNNPAQRICVCNVPATCDDGVSCTADFCDSSDGAMGECVNNPNPTPSSCPPGWTCVPDEPGGGRCRENPNCHADADCDDGVDCTQDSCNDVTGGCLHQTLPCPAGQFCGPSGCRCVKSCDLGCSDGLFCNGAEECDGATDCCKKASSVPCPNSDGIACTDECDELTDSCVASTPNEAKCPAVLHCTAGEGCTCANDEECVTLFGGTLCAVCNGAPTGTCQLSPAAATCDDGKACTLDRCLKPNPQDGADCVHVVNPSYLCPVGMFCDLLSGPGQPDATGCRSFGSCSHPSQCDDTLACNGTESCVNGVCMGGDPICAADPYSCTMDFCTELGPNSSPECMALKNSAACVGFAPNVDCSADPAGDPSGCNAPGVP